MNTVEVIQLGQKVYIVLSGLAIILLAGKLIAGYQIIFA